jgi:hypothetical protein
MAFLRAPSRIQSAAFIAARVDTSTNSRGDTVETPWQGTNADALPIRIQDALNQADLDLKKYIDRERPMWQGYCKNNMSRLMDCACVADAIQAARLAGPTKVEGTRLSPQLAVVVTKTNFGACTSTERITE